MYNGIKIADAGFVINLPKRFDRKYDVDTLLKKMGFDGYIFFNGVEIKDNNWFNFGCTQAYINLFDIILKENYQTVIIFEDDLKIMNSANLDEINDVFYKLPAFSKKYDAIALGTRPIPNFKIKKEDKNFGKIESLLTTHCFLYNKKFIYYLYENLKCYKSLKSKHYKCLIDECINDCCSNKFVLKNKNKIFNIGITIPMIFTQKNSYSDNELINQDYDLWMEECYWNAIS